MFRPGLLAGTVSLSVVLLVLQVQVFEGHRCGCSYCVTGTVELDLHHLIPPSKTPEKCSLKMLPGMSSNPSKTLPTTSLFAQKSARGWWPCVIEQDGKKELGVSTRGFTYIF